MASDAGRNCFLAWAEYFSMFFVIHMKQSMPPQGPVGFETCRFVESGAKLFVFGQKARQKHQAGGVLFCRLFQLQINGKWGRF